MRSIGREYVGTADQPCPRCNQPIHIEVWSVHRDEDATSGAPYVITLVPVITPHTCPTPEEMAA